ncbi:MAG: hypothetical protein EZS28_056064, partial [Streblomastix strix]
VMKKECNKLEKKEKGRVQKKE